MLPRPTAPIYTLTIPSTQKTVRYRPFVMSDVKSLLLAQMSSNVEVMINTLREIIKSCVVDQIDVDSLATFDIEKIFCMLRAKSVEENVSLLITCEHCKEKTKMLFDITKIDVKFKEDHQKSFILYDNVGVCMKYPNYETLLKIQQTPKDDLDSIFDVMVDCVDYIYDDKQMYSPNEVTREEMLEFFYNLTQQQMEKVEHFFETMPTFKHDISFTCPSCNGVSEITIEGIQNFF
jgi:hypothetical protein